MATAAGIVIISLRTGGCSRPLSPWHLLRVLFDFLSFHVLFLRLNRAEKGVLSSRLDFHLRSVDEHVRPRSTPVPRSSYRKGQKLYILLSFDSVRALEIHGVARATSCTACALEMRSSNGRERP